MLVNTKIYLIQCAIDGIYQCFIYLLSSNTSNIGHVGGCVGSYTPGYRPISRDIDQLLSIKYEYERKQVFMGYILI